MKKKQLFSLLMAGVLAILSPSTVYAADFSDFSYEFNDFSYEFNDSSTAQEVIKPSENAPQNDNLSSDDYLTEPDELFQAAPEEAETVFSAQEQSDAEGFASAVPDSDIPQVIDQDDVSYRYMEDKDSYIVEEIYNPAGDRIVIPAEYNGKRVTEIATNIYWSTFEDQDELTILTGDLVLPEGLLVIHPGAFANADFLSLYVPDSVKEMGEKAFINCGMRWLHFPASMPVFPAGLFENCSLLETVEIPEGVTELTSGAFKKCPALKYLYLPATMTKIGEDLFAENAQVTIYGTAGSYAEDYAREHNLPFSPEKETKPTPNQEIVFQNSVRYTYQKSSDTYLATNYTGNIPEEITIPETINNKPVSGIGDKAFINCYRLRRVVLPSAIRSIGERSFSQCLSLEEINLPDGLESVGSSAFEECSLKHVYIPDSVKTFGTSIFKMCFKLKEVRLPKDMTSIPDYMFYWANISTPLSLPKGIKSIGSYAFSGFYGEVPILPSALKTIGDNAFYDSWIESITIPNSVTKMGKEVFEGCSYLRTVNLGNGLKTIPEGTFRYCSVLEEMQLPGTITAIGKNAYNYSPIRRLSVPKSVKKIHKTAFKNCDYVTLFVKKGSYAETFARTNKLRYDNGSITNSIVRQDALRYEYNSGSKTYTIIEADKNIEGDIVIPSTVNGKKVVAIEDKVFEQCKKLRSVKLPNTLKTIGKHAFYYCSALEQINFPSSLASIGQNAFESCKLKSVSLPASVKSIGDYAFSSCEELEKIQFSNGLTEIPYGLCSYCPSLSEIILPDTLVKIGERAFKNTAIASVQLPDTLNYIGSEAFYKCQFLEEVKLPKKLTFLGGSAFSNCNLLKEVVIPAGVKELEDVFTNCISLEKVEIQTGVEEINLSAFEGCSSLKELHIPESVYFISSYGFDDFNPTSFVIYGKSGSSAEDFAKTYGYSFVSVGPSVLGTPVLSRKLVNGNCIRVSLNKRCYNAQSYDYVLTRDSKFPSSGKYLYRRNSSLELKQEFNLLDKGIYYVFARSNRVLKNGQTEYSPWSKAVKTVISTQVPKPPTIKSVSVKGKTVTVVLNKAAGAAGYTCVLAVGSIKEGIQKLLVPSAVRYTKNSTTTKLVFKNVSKGKYKLMVRGYAKQKNGSKVMGKWRARAEKIQIN